MYGRVSLQGDKTKLFRFGVKNFKPGSHLHFLKKQHVPTQNRQISEKKTTFYIVKLSYQENSVPGTSMYTQSTVVLGVKSKLGMLLFEAGIY